MVHSHIPIISGGQAMCELIPQLDAFGVKQVWLPLFQRCRKTYELVELEIKVQGEFFFLNRMWLVDNIQNTRPRSSKLLNCSSLSPVFALINVNHFPLQSSN